MSKTFLDRVDGSLTARRSHAAPSKVILPKGEHDRDACYVRIAFKSGGSVTVVFNRYHLQYNYLEFVQKTEPFVVMGPPLIPDDAPGAPGSTIYFDSTFGTLDLNLWEEQRAQFKNPANPTPPLPPSTSTAGEGSSNPAAAARRTGRRSSITQASLIRGTEHLIQQELASSDPITPLSQTRPVRNATTAAFGISTAPPPPAGLPRDNMGQGESYMARFARMMLGSTASETQPSQTRPGMSAAEVVEEARQLIHTVEPEVFASQKLYKFVLLEGVHYIGDNDFIMKYSVVQDPTAGRVFKVDYIRASWKWITAGIPVKGTKSTTPPPPPNFDDPVTVEDPFPEQRIGRIYAERYNRLLREIKKQELDQRIRGDLAIDGYDLTMLPRNFISINLRSEPVLEWITRLDQAEPSPLNNLSGADDDGGVEFDWEDLSSQSGMNLGQDRDKGKAKSEGNDKDKGDDGTTQQREGSASEIEGQDDDDLELEKLLLSMKQNLGFLNARNILEEMLTHKGYPRELVWKYGFIRRELTGKVPEIQHAQQLVQKVINSEAAAH